MVRFTSETLGKTSTPSVVSFLLKYQSSWNQSISIKKLCNVSMTLYAKHQILLGGMWVTSSSSSFFLLIFIITTTSYLLSIRVSLTIKKTRPTLLEVGAQTMERGGHPWSSHACLISPFSLVFILWGRLCVCSQFVCIISFDLQGSPRRWLCYKKRKWRVRVT